MALPIKKIYVDTRFKTKHSVSNSNFKIELNQSLLFPENSVFYIDDICIPHSWTTVEQNLNDKLYFRVIGQSITPTDHIITLNSQLYTGTTLAQEISTKLTALSYSPTVVYNPQKHQISISITAYSFKFLTESELKNPSIGWTGTSYDKNNLQSSNEILKNTGNVSTTHNSASPYLSYIDLQPIRNIYIHSSMGNFNTLGANGETSIVKKVLVSYNFNEMIIDQVLTYNDFGNCSGQTLRTIRFDLKDVMGNYIPMHGSNLSLSIVFSKQNAGM